MRSHRQTGIAVAKKTWWKLSLTAKLGDFFLQVSKSAFKVLEKFYTQKHTNSVSPELLQGFAHVAFLQNITLLAINLKATWQASFLRSREKANQCNSFGETEEVFDYTFDLKISYKNFQLLNSFCRKSFWKTKRRRSNVILIEITTVKFLVEYFYFPFDLSSLLLSKAKFKADLYPGLA